MPSRLRKPWQRAALKKQRRCCSGSRPTSPPPRARPWCNAWRARRAWAVLTSTTRWVARRCWTRPRPRSWSALWRAPPWSGWMHPMPAWRRACAAWWARSSMRGPRAPLAAWCGCLRARPRLTCLRWALPPAWWPICRRAARAISRTPSPWRAPRWRVLRCRACLHPTFFPLGAFTTLTRPACCPMLPRWRPGARASPRCAACPPWPCWCTATILWMAAPHGSMPGCAPSASRACSPMRPLASSSRRKRWPRCWSCPPKEALAPAPCLQR